MHYYYLFYDFFRLEPELLLFMGNDAVRLAELFASYKAFKNFLALVLEN